MRSPRRSSIQRDPRPQEPAKVGLNTADEDLSNTCHALIDTGATTSMITEKIAGALDLDRDKLDTVEVRGFDGRVVGEYPATDSLWLSVPPCPRMDIPQVVIVPDTALNYQAIIGMDYLGQFEFAIRRGRFGPL